MARVNTSLTVACAPRRSRREMRDAVLTLAYLRGRWDLDGMDAGLCVFVSRPCSDGRADKRYSTTPWRGFAGRCDPMSHGKRTMPGPVAPGRSGSPSELPNSVQMRTIRSSKQPPVREDWLRWAAIARSRFIAFEQEAAGTGLSNGVQMLVDSATDGSTKTAAMHAMARRREQVLRIAGLKA
jgi:hypothetical protein